MCFKCSVDSGFLAMCLPDLFEMSLFCFVGDVFTLLFLFKH